MEAHKEEGEGEHVQGVEGDEERPEARKNEGERVQGGGEKGAHVLHPQVFDTCQREKEGAFPTESRLGRSGGGKTWPGQRGWLKGSWRWSPASSSSGDHGVEAHKEERKGEHV